MPLFAKVIRMTSRLGAAAVAFELPDVSGATYRLRDFADHWLLLVFHRHLG
jgi:peroxiredoxin